ncbi:MAG: NAD(+) synthase [Clostridia bacterium]|nr:NAD(+) synthase [Clostridia bacterium]
MKKELIKVKCLSPEIKLGNPIYNGDLLADEIIRADSEGVDVLCLPELCLCGTSLGDMLSNDVIIRSCESALGKILNKTKGTSVLAIIGLPVKQGKNTCSTGVIIENGKILGAIYNDSIDIKSPLGHIRALSEGFYGEINLLNQKINFSNYFEATKNGNKFGFFLGSGKIQLSATPSVLVNPTSLYETITSEIIATEYAKKKSEALGCAYMLCTPCENESSSNVIFSASNIISQRGEILASALPFESKNGECVSIIECFSNNSSCKFESYSSFAKKLCLNIETSKNPFIPKDEKELNRRLKKILDMESHALARRLTASYSKCCVLGISGGLDSTLALITCVLCADLIGWDRKNVVCVTMPCFGTTSRTKNNATELCNALGVTLKEVNIAEAVSVHLRDIGHDMENRNVTYENAQARERTQVLMDIANDLGGIVIGTGDMSEVALGWSTYNGDHMSMYGVNSAIVKTLIRHVVAYFAKNADKKVADILYDILDTPVSPELLPHKDGEIQQRTEDIVGPYELHDFFIYYFAGKSLAPSEIYHLAVKNFEGIFDCDTIYKWLEIFIKRFFTQHFKRCCSPDAISLGSVSLGKYDLQMPSDMSYEAFLEDLKSIRE